MDTVPNSASTPPFLRITKAVERSGISRSRLYVLLAQGKVDAVRDGRTTLVSWPSIERYIASLPLAQFGSSARAAS